MNIKEALVWSRIELQYACERPLYEAEILLSYHLDMDRVYLKIGDEQMVDRLDDYKSLVARRAAHEPMEYITHSVSFYDIELYIAQGALIPRPETEILIDKCISVIKKHNISSIAEIGVGSGAISIVLARVFPELRIVASDISTEALAIAERNIASFGLSDRIELRHTSLLDGIDREIDMIVSNPPYIALGKPLAPNVAEYEPHTALYSLERGDELLQSIIDLSRDRGVKYLCCEMGYDQRAPISEYVQSMGVSSIEFYKDLAGLDRGFEVEW